MTIVLATTAALLFAIGTYLILQRKLTRIVIGLALLTHGANVLMITSGARGTPPIIGQADPSTFSDPLSQALVLTAIVITFAVTTLLLALGYRSWLLTDDDEVEDDLGDRSIARGATLRKEIADQETSMSHDTDEGGP